MNRRTFLENLFIGSAALGTGAYLIHGNRSDMPLDRKLLAKLVPNVPSDEGSSARQIARLSRKQEQLKVPVFESDLILAEHGTPESNKEVMPLEESMGGDEKKSDGVVRTAQSDQDKVASHWDTFTDDVYASDDQFKIIVSSWERLNRIQKYVGFAHFNLVSFDQALAYAKRVSEIGAFSKEEIALLELLFYEDVGRLGFKGERVVGKMTDVINKDAVLKIPQTGHYLYQGESLKLYDRLRKDVGEDLVLTSGVRSVVKQADLFLSKAIRTEGNLSKASRSLAPPAHSFHSIGDFDVGKIGLGLKNFTNEFSETEEFKKIKSLEYIQIRYTTDNTFGVRYEPWHIRVV